MRCFLRDLLSFCAALLPGAVAGAVPLAGAEISFQFMTMPPAVLSATGATGSSTSNLAANLDPGNAFDGTATATTPNPVNGVITKLSVKFTGGNAAALFTGPAPSSVGGAARISGVASLYGLGLKLLDVPVALGVPDTIVKSGGGVITTVVNAPWTAGIAMITGPTANRGGTVMATRTGANALTPGGAGELLLVTPVKIVTNITGTLPTFAFLRLTYVPEPSTITLLGFGVAGLAALGRARTRAKPKPTGVR